MSHRPFVLWPDNRLRTAAAPVGSLTDDVRAVWSEMIEAMEAMPGVGLAAPQLGVMLQLAVVDASEERGQVVRMANPTLVSASDRLRGHEEASPNLPGVWARVDRPAKVRVRFMDETGAVVERDFEGLWATSVQHQIDHLEGKIYADRLSKLKRDRLLKKYAKARAAGK